MQKVFKSKCRTEEVFGILITVLDKEIEKQLFKKLF